MTSFVPTSNSTVESSNTTDMNQFFFQQDPEFMNPLTHSLVPNNATFGFDSDTSAHDSPSSYVSNSSEDGVYHHSEAVTAIEDYDGYDMDHYGGYLAPTTSMDLLLNGNHHHHHHLAPHATNNNSTDGNTASMLSSDKALLQQQQHYAAMKSAFVAAAMKQQQHQHAIVPPASYSTTMTPQQLQEQYMLVHQQRAQMAAQQYAATYGAPFTNPFAMTYQTSPPMAHFIHPHPSPTQSMISSSAATNGGVNSSVTATMKASPPASPSVTSPNSTSIMSSNTSASSIEDPSSPKTDRQAPSPTQSSASKSKKKSVNSSAPKRPRESSDSSPTDEALAELDLKKPANVEEDKEVKRQRRLVKNRESAQASRERKKLYVKGLEARVEELATKNSDLNAKLQAMEEENKRLRERLTMIDPSGLQLHDALEPDAKKRKLNKMMPNKPTYNPFDVNFWAAFMGGYPNHPAPPQQQQVPPQPQMHPGHSMSTMAPHEQSALAAWANPATLGSKRVVMFIMLFCVAVMVMLPKDMAPASLSSSETPVSLSDGAPIKRSHSRLLKFFQSEEATSGTTVQSSDFQTKIKVVYDKFASLMQNSSESNIVDSVVQIKPDFAFDVQLDNEKQSLQISFPLNKVVKQEEEEDVEMEKKDTSVDQPDVLAEDVKKEQETDSKEDTVESLSVELLREVCRKMVN